MKSVRMLLSLMLFLTLTGCTAAPKEFTAQVLPAPSAQPPRLMVYITSEDTLVPMDIETYVTRVVAGEMPGDWPMEALKAQSILARTFVLKFITEKDSRYPGADISTDIAEAQAYNAEAVNDCIRQAVQETRGIILLTADQQLPYTWFHAHSGGKTETAVSGIDWQGDEPDYTRVTDGRDSTDAPETIQRWTATFSLDEFIAACREAGSDVSSCETIKIGQKGKSGRAVTLVVDGTTVNAARLRIALGSTKMRSTLLTELSAKDGVVTLSGRGYGHGVGMPQWGAYALAKIGMTGEDIALHYYNELQIVRVW